MSQLSKQVDTFVGARIRESRARLGLTQEKLADALRLSFQQVQKYETGANRISAGRLFEVAQLLKVDIDYFYEGFDEHSPMTPMKHGGRGRAALELAKNFSKIQDSDVRSAVSDMVRVDSDAKCNIYSE